MYAQQAPCLMCQSVLTDCELSCISLTLEKMIEYIYKLHCCFVIASLIVTSFRDNITSKCQGKGWSFIHTAHVTGLMSQKSY